MLPKCTMISAGETPAVRATLASEKPSPLPFQPHFTAMILATTIRATDARMPGPKPPINSLPTEALVATPRVKYVIEAADELAVAQVGPVDNPYNPLGIVFAFANIASDEEVDDEQEFEKFDEFVHTLSPDDF